MTRARDLAAGTFEQATGGVLKLETSDTTVTDGSVLGKIEFKAPDEASGTDAILVGAAIEAVAEGTFAADNNATELVFKTGASAAADAKMTLTSGGDLLVGKTSAGLSTAGVQLDATGSGGFCRAETCLTLSRLSTDGSILDFRKDSTTVGSVGVNTTGAELFIEGVSGKAGLRFGSAKITASLGGTTSGQDGVVDLGQSSTRFKDLYLSGGVFLGGTGAANKLSDYEEGTHQTSITMGTSGTVTLNTTYDRFSYTKTGRLVTITGNPRISSVSSPVGAMTLTLPFAAASGESDECRSGGFIKYYDASAGSGSYIKVLGCNVNEGTSVLSLNNTHTHNNNFTPAADDEFYICFSYITA